MAGGGSSGVFWAASGAASVNAKRIVL